MGNFSSCVVIIDLYICPSYSEFWEIRNASYLFSYSHTVWSIKGAHSIHAGQINEWF